MGSNLTALDKTRTDTDQLAKKIMDNANAIVNDAKNIGWDPANPTVCGKIAFYYKDQLNQFNKDLLGKAAYQMGLLYDQDIPDKKVILDKIVDYYAKKATLSELIINNLESGCRANEEVIVSNFSSLLPGLSAKDQEEATARLNRLETSLNRFYSRLNDNLVRLRQPISMQELETIEKDTYNWLTSQFNECCQLTYDLRDFYWQQAINEKVGQKSQIYYYNSYYGNDSSTYDRPSITKLSPKGGPNSPACTASVAASMKKPYDTQGYCS